MLTVSPNIVVCCEPAAHVYHHFLAQQHGLKIGFIAVESALGIRARIHVIDKHFWHAASVNAAHVCDTGDVIEIFHVVIFGYR